MWRSFNSGVRQVIWLYIKASTYYFTVVSLLVTYIGYGVTPATNISTRARLLLVPVARDQD